MAVRKVLDGANMGDQVVLITGAASGIGRAAVDLYSERGYSVVAVDINASLLAGLAAREAVRNFDRIIAVNLRGVLLGIRAAVPALRAAGGGAIVATSSVSGLRGDPGTWAYNASKAAVINLVRALAIDYAADNIRINAIAPGGTATALTARQTADPELGPFLTRRIPQQRWADPREQAEVLWFLTSPAASYITGATLPVDGGLSASGGLLLPREPASAPALPPRGAPVMSQSVSEAPSAYPRSSSRRNISTTRLGSGRSPRPPSAASSVLAGCSAPSTARREPARPCSSPG